MKKKLSKLLAIIFCFAIFFSSFSGMVYAHDGGGQQPTYTVTFNSQGGSVVSAKTGIAYDAKITLPSDPTKAGYTFEGWNTNSNGSGSDFTSNTHVKASLTVYAQWKVIPTYTVTFNSQGGSDVSAKTGIAYDAKITLPSDPTKTGYTFEGWNTNSNGSGSDFTSSTHVKANITVYAQWKVIPTYTVTFNSQGGTLVAAISGIAYNGKISLPTNPTKAGFTFDGWNTNSNGHGSDFTSNTHVTASITVYAQWKEQHDDNNCVKKYTVTYAPGDHGTFSLTSTGGLILGATTPTAPAALGEAGYTFTGWSPSVDSTVTKDATYTAQWSQNQYTVTYAPGDHGTFDITSTGGLILGATTPTAPAITGEDGYTFDGWSPSLELTVTKDETYTAQWSIKDEVQTFTVTFAPGTQGTFTSQVTSGLLAGATTPTAPVVTGNSNYNFDGWDSKVAETVSGDVIYTALWSAKTVNIIYDFKQTPPEVTVVVITPEAIAETPAPVVEPEVVVITPEAIAAAPMAKTGGLSDIGFLLAGLLFTALGLVYRKKLQEDDKN
ncbi:MAG: InlB B-repeat-containing protein [Clostridia bacterium]